jgi:hypothetical protein
MASATELQQARDAYRDAVAAYAHPDAIQRLAAEVARLEGQDPAISARNLRTAARDLRAGAERFLVSAGYEIKANRFASAVADLELAIERIAEAVKVEAEADAISAPFQAKAA